MKSIFAVSLLLVTTICCCCGGSWTSGFDEAQLQELFGSNFEQILENADVDLTQVLGTPTPSTVTQESIAEPVMPDSAEMPAEVAPEMPVEQPPVEEGTLEQPPVEEGTLEQPPADDAEALLGELEQQLGEVDESLSLGCEEATVPLPDDAESCMSVAGFTTYSTALGKDEINQLYDDYFKGQGWSQFAPMIQEDVINAWSSDAGFAFVTFTLNGGENGKNLVSVGEVTE